MIFNLPLVCYKKLGAIFIGIINCKGGEMFIGVTLVCITLILISLPIGAEMYRWVDDNGVVTFKDSPPPLSKKRKKVKTYTEGDFTPAPSTQPAVGTQEERTAKPLPQAITPKKEHFNGVVEIFVTGWCGYCKKALDYMTRKGIKFVAYDIEKDSAASQRHKELGGRGVPLIIIGSNKMNGFSPETLEYYLNNSRECMGEKPWG
jgi:glutaredoxin